jgi:EpsI family protein
MKQGRRQALALAAAMAGTAAFAAYVRPRAIAPDRRLVLDRLFPTQFGRWETDRVAGAFVRAADRQGQVSRLYDQVLERTFIDPAGQRVMLSVVYGAAQSADLQLHRPEVCYRAGGFRVGDLQQATLTPDGRVLPVTRLLASMPGRPEPITYWMLRGGQHAARSEVPLGTRLRSLLQRVEADSLLVRVSSIDDDAQRAYRLHAEFVAELLRAIAPADRALVAGTPPQG